MAQIVSTHSVGSASATKSALSYVVQIVPPVEVEREALAMENLLQSFSLKEPFSLEICGELRQQRFLLRASSEQGLRTLCQQVLAQYPQARIRRLFVKSDPLRLHTGEHALVGNFTLRAATWLPIKTFWNEEMTQVGTDPVVGLLSAMEPVKKGERIVSQISLISAPDTWMQNYRRKAIETPLERERQERQEVQRTTQQPSSDESLWKEARFYIPLLAVIAAGIQGYRWYLSHAWQPLVLLIVSILCLVGLFVWWRLRHDTTLYDAKLVSEKLLRVAFYAQVKVIIIGSQHSTEQKLRGHLERLEVAYRQYNLANSNGFQLKEIQHVDSTDELVATFVSPECNLPYHRPFARFLHKGWSKTVLNAREVSGMWHLLQKEAEVPLIERLASKRILAQPELFQRVLHQPKKFPPVLIGHSEHRGHSVPIYLPQETIFSHKFVVAKSGYGKSTLMQLLLRGAMMPTPHPQFLQPGVVAIDPHGDLIDDLLRQVPVERTQDVILIDLADSDHPPGINLLDASMGFSADQAIANMMGSFSRIWADSWGPRLAYVLKHALMSLYTVNELLVAQGKKEEQYTLLDVNPLLQQSKYARKVLSVLDKDNIQHQKELTWWNDYYFKLAPNFQQEIINPVCYKIGLFSDNHMLERIVGQSVTTINVNACVTEGKIVLANLASGRLEFDAAAIIGATILNLVHRMLQLQASVPLPDRRQVFIAVDEFQNIPGADYEAYLSEDRKYGASIMLATQSLIRLEQMKEGLEQMTFSNCAQLFVFATSAEDGEKLEKELHEQVTVPYILNQPRLTCYARLALPDQPVQIFSMKLATPEGWKRTAENEARAARIRARNQAGRLSHNDIDQMLEQSVRWYTSLSGPESNQQEEKRKSYPSAKRGKPSGQSASPPEIVVIQADIQQAVEMPKKDSAIEKEGSEGKEEKPGCESVGEGVVLPQSDQRKRKRHRKRKPLQDTGKPGEVLSSDGEDSSEENDMADEEMAHLL
jgi:hypothetical protein